MTSHQRNGAASDCRPKRLGPLVAVLWLLVGNSLAADADSRCVVLQYHHFGTDTPRITSVAPAEFDAHLDYLREREFKVQPLHQVVAKLRKGEPLPQPCVAISIDDAYRSIYTQAWPRLRRLSWPFTVFVNTQGVDQGGGAYMNWEQMRQMAATGAYFENHSHSHAHLVRRRPEESKQDWLTRVRTDIVTAQTRIKQELGRAPTLFAWPYGEYTDALTDQLAALGLSGFGQHSGPAWSGGAMSALPRFPMAAQYAAMPGFRTKVNSLPLPLVSALPTEPVLEGENRRPRLSLRFAPSLPAPKGRLTCFANGSPKVTLAWKDTHEVTVRSDLALPAGRSRYNCTLPSAHKGVFHWYSHPWIRRLDDGYWYRE